MQLSSIPAKFQAPFAYQATSSYINQVPLTTSTPDAASLTLGFPPATAQAGGAPSIKDFNGVLNQGTAWNQWQGGMGVPYDAAFSSEIGGYWQGAFLLAASGNHFWVSTADNNTSDPDTGGANWAVMSSLPSGAAGGSLAGTYPNPSFAAPFNSTANLLAALGFSFGSNANGSWKKLPDGTIEQYGFVSGSFNESTQSVTLPIPFPNSFTWAGGNTLNSGPAYNADLFLQVETAPGTGAYSSINFYIDSSSTSTPVQGFFWGARGT